MRNGFIAGGIAFLVFGLFTLVSSVRWNRILTEQYKKQGFEVEESTLRWRGLLLAALFFSLGLMALLGIRP